jgi:hypothetical protein
MQKLVKDKQITEDKCFNLTFKYNGDVLSINNPNSAFWITLISYFLQTLYNQFVIYSLYSNRMEQTRHIFLQLTVWNCY